jgi:MFS superfamily sulfate permease-like transporter
MMNTYWFKPRQRGWGATPVTWEGWAVTVVTMVIVVMTSMLAPVFSRGTAWDYSAIIIDVVAIAAFLMINRLKTDGEWRRRKS